MLLSLGAADLVAQEGQSSGSGARTTAQQPGERDAGGQQDRDRGTGTQSPRTGAPQGQQPATGQAGAPRESHEAHRAAGPGEVTLVGCVEFESDYRKRMDAGRGGALGTGIGQSDEFVLTMATRQPAGSAQRTAEGSSQVASSGKPEAGGAAVGTAGSSQAYTITGDAEEQLKRAVGQQIEIVGRLDDAADGASGAKNPDNLPQVTITAWHPVSDFCPAPNAQQPNAQRPGGQQGGAQTPDTPR